MNTRKYYIQKEGQTFAPLPLYPNEIIDEIGSIGKMKSKEQKFDELRFANKSFAYQLIEADIIEILG